MGEVTKQRRTLVIPNVAVATYTTECSNYVSDLYQKKYHCKFENETKMMVDISKNGSFIIKRGRKTKKLKMNNELQFVEYGDIQF